MMNNADAASRGPAIVVHDLHVKRVRIPVLQGLSLAVPGGMIVLAGIIEAQAARVAAAYAPQFDDLEQHARDGWVRIAGRRKAG